MIIQTTSKHLIELIEDLAKDLKKDRDLSPLNKISTLEGAVGLAACLIDDILDYDSVEAIARIKAEFQLYLTLVEDYEEGE